jgi:iron-sulfur cluster assembly protein
MNEILKLTTNAINHFSKLSPDELVCLSIISGSCAGFKYNWHVLPSTSEELTDYEYISVGEFTMAIDKMSILYLIGSTIDYKSDITGGKIVITNPNAIASCGCGESIRLS